MKAVTFRQGFRIAVVAVLAGCFGFDPSDTGLGTNTGETCDEAFAGCSGKYEDKTGVTNQIVTTTPNGDTFSPKCLKLKAGSRVDIVSQGHAFIAKCATGGATFTTGGVVLKNVGFYNYYCSIHGTLGDGTGMAGSIWVVP